MAESLDKKYLLVGECKWTAGENGDRLLYELKEKAGKLSFAKNKTIVPVLFLKHLPVGKVSNVLLPKDIIELSTK